MILYVRNKKLGFKIYIFCFCLIGAVKGFFFLKFEYVLEVYIGILLDFDVLGNLLVICGFCFRCDICLLFYIF